MPAAFSYGNTIRDAAIFYFCDMKILSITLSFLLFSAGLSGYTQNSRYEKDIQVERYLGTAINNGKGYKEGGRDIEFYGLTEGEQLEFKVKSGVCQSVTLMLKSKYGGWATIYQGPTRVLTYEKYFKRHVKNNQVSAFSISVNGSHGNYDRVKCALDVILVTWEQPSREHYKVELEKDSVVEGGRRNAENQYRGVVVDGISTVDIEFQLPNNQKIVVLPPEIGSIIAKGSSTLETNHNETLSSSKILTLNSRGKGTLTYVPPAYVQPHIWYGLKSEKDFSFQDFNPPGKYYNQSTSRKVYIHYKYVDHHADVVTDSLLIELFKPTLLFVHGFLGDGSTWQDMAGRFERLDYTTFRADYHAGSDESIDNQSAKLAADVNKELNHLRKSGIKAAKVDLICHSMGGLIARNYLLNEELYTKPLVRKLITVGTPHHGVNDWGYYAGKFGAIWFRKHRTAIEQLHESSSFLRILNAKPATGNRDLEFEFGNIYVIPWDGITYASSAYLNGVISYKLQDLWHSTSIRENSITNSREVRNVIFEWLESPIKSLPLQNIHMAITSGARQSIETSYIEPVTQDTIISFVGKFPAELRTTESVRAFRGNCTIELKKGKSRWGMINMQKGSALRIGYCTPEYMTIYMIKGKAHFNSYQNGGHFHVFLTALNKNNPDETGGAYNIDMTPAVIGKNTEFIVDLENDKARAFSLDGDVILLDGKTEAGDEKVFSSGQGIRLDVNGSEMLSSLPREKWWTTFASEENQENTRITETGSDEDVHENLLLGYIILALLAVAAVLIIYFAIRKIKKLIQKK
ncbi:alpha/beta fold hydrolase [Lentimicrobium sp.]|uniref:alpha/beta fold hydrolase n=1 Tax=Lentimicrobium sp. TaxID=2034841 RepID=UPI002D0CA197|nr:alpha/beta fold hydrolase [Lentimicrobium sp.]HPR25388.1 alpha/beta fold hydrolase [Lentimicrobium sp.]